MNKPLINCPICHGSGKDKDGNDCVCIGLPQPDDIRLKIINEEIKIRETQRSPTQRSHEAVSEFYKKQQNQ